MQWCCVLASFVGMTSDFSGGFPCFYGTTEWKELYFVKLKVVGYNKVKLYVKVERTDNCVLFTKIPQSLVLPFCFQCVKSYRYYAVSIYRRILYIRS